MSIEQLECLNNYAYQRRTTEEWSASHQLPPFSKCELLLKERISSLREQILSFKSSPYVMEKDYFHI